jgi:hypothetical protein
MYVCIYVCMYVCIYVCMYIGELRLNTQNSSKGGVEEVQGLGEREAGKEGGEGGGVGGMGGLGGAGEVGEDELEEEVLEWREGGVWGEGRWMPEGMAREEDVSLGGEPFLDCQVVCVCVYACMREWVGV